MAITINAYEAGTLNELTKNEPDLSLAGHIELKATDISDCPRVLRIIGMPATVILGDPKGANNFKFLLTRKNIRDLIELLSKAEQDDA